VQQAHTNAFKGVEGRKVSCRWLQRQH
jgi:hypothetical protein